MEEEGLFHVLSQKKIMKIMKSQYVCVYAHLYYFHFSLFHFLTVHIINIYAELDQLLLKCISITKYKLHLLVFQLLNNTASMELGQKPGVSVPRRHS